jgi:hypothetical protein
MQLASKDIRPSCGSKASNVTITVEVVITRLSLSVAMCFV